MKCPKCENEYVCPCDSCMERKKDKVPWTLKGTNDDDMEQACPNCGFSKSIHWWFEEQFRQYEKTKVNL